MASAVSDESAAIRASEAAAAASKGPADNQHEHELETALVAAAAVDEVAEAQRREELRTLRVAFVGNVDSGKSSLIGTLIKGELDDGRGAARKAVFRHKHEQESGRTSSVATAYLGFDDAGEQILSKRAGKLLPWVELARVAHKRIQLIDLAGAFPTLTDRCSLVSCGCWTGSDGEGATNETK